MKKDKGICQLAIEQKLKSCFEVNLGIISERKSRAARSMKKQVFGGRTAGSRLWRV